MAFNIILLSLMLLLTGCGRIATGSWITPGVMFSCIWCFFSLLPLLVLGDIALLNPIGLSWITIVVFLSIFLDIVVGSSVGGLKSVSNTGMNRRIQLNASRLYCNIFFLLVFVFLGFIPSYFLIKNYGYSFKSIFRIDILFDLGGAVSYDRYAEVYRESLPIKIFKQCIYIAPGIGGILHAIYPSKKIKLMALFSFAPSLVWTLILTTKAALIFSIGIYFTWYLSVSLYVRRNLALKYYFSLGRVFIVLFLVICTFIVSSAVRYHGFDMTLISDKLVSTFFSQIFIFSEWFAQNWNQLDAPLYGELSFNGIYSAILDSTRRIGLGYTSMSSLGMDSNIFTIHRLLIEDFSLFGAILWFVVIFFLGSVSFFKIINSSHNPYIYIGLLSCVYSVIIWSPVTSVFAYNSIIISNTIVFIFYIIIYRSELN